MRTFHRWGDQVFIIGDLGKFSNWMMTRNRIFPCRRMTQCFSHWVGDFLSLSLTGLLGIIEER